MKTRYLLALALTASGSAIVAETRAFAPAVALGEHSRVAPGIEIEPLAVIEDSRCPITVDCITAGRLVLAANVHHGTKVTAVRLTLGSPHPIAGGELVLSGVSPAKPEALIPPQNYRFSFDFKPAGDNPTP